MATCAAATARTSLRFATWMSSTQPGPSRNIPTPNATKTTAKCSTRSRTLAIDGVIIATLDHTHAIISMAAIKAGKHVYCEKPLTHTLYRAGELAKAAREHNVVTQMGIQGHSMDGIRLVTEWINDGGNRRGAHGSDLDRPPRQLVASGCWPPGGFASRSRHAHGICGGCAGAAHNLRTARLFGEAGGISAAAPWATWACHLMDAPFSALQLGYPTTVEASSTPVNDETAPLASMITYGFQRAARNRL